MSGRLGKSRPHLAQSWSTLTKSGPKLAYFGRCRPSLGRTCQLRPISTKLAEFDQIWPLPTNFGPNLSNAAEIWAGIRPTPANLDRCLRVSGVEGGRIIAQLGGAELIPDFVPSKDMHNFVQADGDTYAPLFGGAKTCSA